MMTRCGLFVSLATVLVSVVEAEYGVTTGAWAAPFTDWSEECSASSADDDGFVLTWDATESDANKQICFAKCEELAAAAAEFSCDYSDDGVRPSGCWCCCQGLGADGFVWDSSKWCMASSRYVVESYIWLDCLPPSCPEDYDVVGRCCDSGDTCTLFPRWCLPPPPFVDSSFPLFVRGR